MDQDQIKSSTKLRLTSKIKEYLCIVCCENIKNWNYRLKLFHKDAKTDQCLLLEKHLQITVTRTGFTVHICRACFRKLAHVDRKVSELKDKFEASIKAVEFTRVTIRRKHY